jgi:hypothetical protein
LIKIFGTSLLKQVMLGQGRAGSGPRQHSFKRVSDKDPGSNQGHHRCDHFEHRKHPLRPARTKRRGSPHSQKDFEALTHNRPRLGIWRNRCTKTEQMSANRVAEKQPLINQRQTLPISAVFRLRYL